MARLRALVRRAPRPWVTFVAPQPVELACAAPPATHWAAEPNRDSAPSRPDRWYSVVQETGEPRRSLDDVGRCARRRARRRRTTRSSSYRRGAPNAVDAERQFRAASAPAERCHERLSEGHPIRVCDPRRHRSARNDAHAQPGSDEQPRLREVRYCGRWDNRGGKAHRQPATHLLLTCGQLVVGSHPDSVPDLASVPAPSGGSGTSQAPATRASARPRYGCRSCW